VARKTKSVIPARLEVRTEDGSTFIETDRIIRDPDLQNRCLEKRELKRIMKIMEERGTLERHPDSAKPKSGPTKSPLRKR
jgi:hypothetical protein